MYTAHNGMNLSKSIGNPKSRFEKVRYYLFVNGPRTKREILRDVFGKVVADHPTGWGTNTPPNVVSMGWGCYMFSLASKNGLFRKVRKGNVTYWSV